MKRIQVTENQLQTIREFDDDGLQYSEENIQQSYKAFVDYVSDKTATLQGIFNELSNYSINEIITNPELHDKFSRLWDPLDKFNTEANKLYGTYENRADYPTEEVDSNTNFTRGREAWNLKHSFDSKIGYLQDLSSDMGDMGLKYSQDEEDITKSFDPKEI